MSEPVQPGESSGSADALRIDGRTTTPTRPGKQTPSSGQKVMEEEKEGDEVQNEVADPLETQVEELRRKQNALRKERKQVAAQIRNVERKKQRIRRRARQLTDADLVQVLAMRRCASEKKEGKKAKTEATAQQEEEEL